MSFGTETPNTKKFGKEGLDVQQLLLQQMATLPHTQRRMSYLYQQ
jgi:hypothetical protein